MYDDLVKSPYRESLPGDISAGDQEVLFPSEFFSTVEGRSYPVGYKFHGRIVLCWLLMR